MLKAQPLVRTNISLSGNVQMIVNESYKVKFAPLVDANSNNFEIMSVGGTYADNATRLWKQLRYGMSQIYDVNNNNIQTYEYTTSLAAQYDWQYMFGARQTSKPNTYRFFAPVLLSKVGKNPSYFLIFECDDIQTQSLTELIHKHGKLICKYDLARLTELQTHMQSMSFAPVYYSHSELQKHRMWGFDISTGQYNEYVIGNVKSMGPEQSPIELSQKLRDIWRQNKCICSQLVNLSFEFRATAPGIHRYVGIYADYAESNELSADESLIDFPYFKYFSDTLNLLEYTTYDSVSATITDDIALMPNVINYNKMYSEQIIASFDGNDGIRPNIYTQQRSITFRWTGIMEPGESFTVLVDDKVDLHVYCIHKYRNDLNGDKNWFTRKHDLESTIEAFEAAFNWYANYKSKYAYRLVKNQNGTYTIFSNSNSNNVKIQVNVAPYTMSVVSATGFAKPWQQMIDFDAAITTSNSIIVNKNLLGYLQQANYILLHLPTGDVKTQIVRLANISEINPDVEVDNLIVVMINSVIQEFSESISFDLLLIKHATINMCQLYDYYDFDAYFWNTCNACTPYMSNNEFDIDAWKDYMTSYIADMDKATLTETELEQYKQTIETYYNANKSLKVHAVKSLNTVTNAIEFTDNVHDKSHDLQSFYKYNKPNIDMSHWCNITGLNAMNASWRIDNSVAYNVLAMSPYENIVNYDLNSFTYSWFIEGFAMPEYIAHMPIHKKRLFAKSYTTDTITIRDLMSTQHDAYATKLCHYFNIAESDASQSSQSIIETVKCYEIIHSMPGSTSAYVTFKGVQYMLSSNYIGYKFAVIHIDNDKPFSSTPQFIVNHTFKACTIVLPYKVIDRAITSLDGLLNKDKNGSVTQTLQVDKSLLYSALPLQIVKPLQDITAEIAFNVNDYERRKLWQWIDMSSSDISKHSPYKFAMIRVNKSTHKVVTDEELEHGNIPELVNDTIAYFGMTAKCLTTDYKLSDIYSVGESFYTLYKQHDDNGNVIKQIKIIFSNIVNITNDIVWVADIVALKRNFEIIDEHDKDAYIALFKDDDDTNEEAINKCKFSYLYSKDITGGFLNGGNIIANSTRYYIERSAPSIDASLTIGLNRWSAISFSSMFNKINDTLDEVSILQHTLQQQQVAVSAVDSTNTLIALIRYGMYCQPCLINLTNFMSLIVDRIELQISLEQTKTTDILESTCFNNDNISIQTYAMLNESDTVHNTIQLYDSTFSTPLKYVELPLMAANNDNIYVQWNITDLTFNMVKDSMQTWQEIPLLASRQIALTSLSTKISFSDGGGQLTINLVDVITTLMNDNIPNKTSIATWLLKHYANIYIVFTNIEQLEVKPIAIDWTDLSIYKPTFDAAVGPLVATITFG